MLVPSLHILPSPGFRNRGWGIIAEGDIFKPHEDQVLNIQTKVLADEDRRPLPIGYPKVLL